MKFTLNISKLHQHEFYANNTFESDSKPDHLLLLSEKSKNLLGPFSIYKTLLKDANLALKSVYYRLIESR